MKKLRQEQGVTEPVTSISTGNLNENMYNTIDISSNDFTDDNVAISSYKLMISILNSEFKLARQDDEHLAGSVRKGPSKFPRTCALLCLLEIVSDIASKVLKHIVFEEGNFTRPNSQSNKFISSNFVNAAREHVNDYLLNLPSVNNRPIIYIDKNQVERAFTFYSYVESTTKVLFDTSNLNQMISNSEETLSTNNLSKQ
jgi:hypothetical protein